MPAESAFSPLKHRAFAVMWVASLISNIGSWMHSVGAAWLMTGLSPSPLIVSMVQTATTLPMFLFVLPAGALADIFNRRQLLLITNIMLCLAAAVFAWMVWRQMITANLLLLFTFLLGAGSAFMAPAWQAIIPSLVPKQDLTQAVTLGGININLSRAIGPALAGLLISAYGLVTPFIANSLSFSVIILALLWWRYESPAASQTLPPERVFAAMRTGIRYAWYSEPMKATMWHILGFMFFANAFWGLLPIIAKQQLAGDATFFGLLMTMIGLGAVGGAFLLPKLQSRFNANQLVALGTLGIALVTAYFGFATNQLIALLTSLIFGSSWIFVLSTVSVSAQQALPDWVRARGLAVFMMVFFGSMSLGAASWGWLAEITSIQTAMLSAAAGGSLFILFSFRAVLQQGKDLDLTPSNHWAEPIIHADINQKTGAVIIQIHYEIASQDRKAFLQAVYRLKAARHRDGGYNWGIYEDTAHSGHFIEQFTEASWTEHLRHHARVTHADKSLQDAVFAFHQGKTPPQVKHFLQAV